MTRGTLERPDISLFNKSWAHLTSAIALAELDREDEAREKIAHAVEALPSFASLSWLNSARRRAQLPDAGLAELDRIVEIWRRLGLPE